MSFLPFSSLAISVSIFALVYALFLTIVTLRQPTGTPKMREIAKAIQEGASAYLNRQSLTILVFATAIFLVLSVILPKGLHNDGILISIGFIVGAVFSTLAGYIGMSVSVRANVRTAEAAKTSLQSALSVAFRGGSVTGLAVVGLALLGVSGFY